MPAGVKLGLQNNNINIYSGSAKYPIIVLIYSGTEQHTQALRVDWFGNQHAGLANVVHVPS